MKESVPIETSLKQPFSSSFGIDVSSKGRSEMDDWEPLRQVPVPSTSLYSTYTLDPRLNITPDKSLGLATLVKDAGGRGSEVKGAGGRGSGDNRKKGKPRVHFAPGTNTSPPSAKTNVIDETISAPDSDSIPRSFSALTSRLYDPNKYSEQRAGLKPQGSSASVSMSSTSASLSSAPAPKQYTVEKRGNSAMDPSTTNILSSYSRQHNGSVSSIKATVVRHKSTDTDPTASDTEVKEALGRSSGRGSPGGRSSSSSRQSVLNSSPSPSPITLRHASTFPSPSSSPTRLRSSSASPTRLSSRSSRSPSPTRSPDRCRSGSSSPGRSPPLSPGVQLPPDDDEDTSGIQVIREAPLRPKINDYIFPFSAADQDTGYDSFFENPLARPEFNSALKISEELKSAKAKKPDTWANVTKTLSSEHRKRTQIQEKASSKVNVQMQSGLYSGLADLDLPLDQMCSSVEKEKTLKAPLVSAAPAKVPVGKKPDLMEFFNSDLQREFPDLTLIGMTSVAEALTQADPSLAFDLYRHNRSWDGLTDS